MIIFEAGSWATGTLGLIVLIFLFFAHAHIFFLQQKVKEEYIYLPKAISLLETIQAILKAK